MNKDRDAEGRYQPGHTSGNVKHGGESAVKAIKDGRSFSGLAAQAELEVQADLRDSGRVFLVREGAKLRVKIRGLLANWNIPCKGTITPAKARELAPKRPWSDQFRTEELALLLEAVQARLDCAVETLRSFRKEGPESEMKSRDIIETVPGVGSVTSDVILSTLGDLERFRSLKRAIAYAGLVPGIRQSDKTRKELPITKEGSQLLRWVMVQAAWRAIRFSEYWGECFEKLAKRRGRKKAAVAIARRLLGVIYTLLKKRRPYCEKMRAHEKLVLFGRLKAKRAKAPERMVVHTPKA